MIVGSRRKQRGALRTHDSAGGLPWSDSLVGCGAGAWWSCAPVVHLGHDLGIAGLAWFYSLAATPGGRIVLKMFYTPTYTKPKNTNLQNEKGYEIPYGSQ